MFSSYEQDRQTDRQTNEVQCVMAYREVWPDNERIIIIMLCTLFFGLMSTQRVCGLNIDSSKYKDTTATMGQQDSSTVGWRA